MSYGLVNAIQTTIFWRWLNGIACNSNVFPSVGHSHDVGKYAGGGYVWNWKGGVREGREVDAHFNLFPIPSKVISFQKYEQNTGYGK